MKTFVRLIRRYVLAAVGIVLLLVFLGLGLLVFLGWQETTHLPQRTYASSEIADAMVETPAGLALGAAHTPEEWMDGYAWAMVLDDTGNIRWSYALPDALNHAYTTGEVAGFARWYLDDYPVFCWAEDYGLFRHRACQREFVEIQHLHLAGVHPEPCQNHSAGVWAAVAAGSDLLFSAQLAGSQAAGNGGFRAGCAGRGADRTAAYGGLCRGTGRKAEPDQCAAANAERTAGPAGRCPHPVDRRGQP